MRGVTIGGIIYINSRFDLDFMCLVLMSLLLHRFFNIVMVYISVMAQGGRLWVIFLNRVGRVLGRNFFDPIIKIRGVRVFSSDLVCDSISHQKDTTIFLVSGLCAQILYNMFVTSFTTIVKDSIICNGGFPVNGNLILCALGDPTGMVFSIMGERCGAGFCVVRDL